MSALHEMGAEEFTAWLRTQGGNVRSMYWNDPRNLDQPIERSRYEVYWRFMLVCMALIAAGALVAPIVILLAAAFRVF